MDEQRVGKITGTAQELAELTLGSYRTIWDSFAEAQKDQARLSQRLFADTLDNFRTHAERNLTASEELVEQARRRRQEAGTVLARKSATAYSQFLDSLFSYYRESVRAAEKRD